ncbi:MAG TPA: glycosyltransferase, partial [Phycisphaerae bacterium]|nr:glycosyltransferase [Phycisphaerae bacterium]
MSVELKHNVSPSTCQPLSVGRVALVVDSLAAGGKERVVATLAGQLRRKGLAVAVVCLSRTGPLAQGLTQAGAAVYSVTSRGRWDLGAVLRLSKILHHIRPDVVNVHDRFSLPYLVAANRIATGAPIVLSCHGLLLSSAGPTWAQILAAREVDAFTAVSTEVAAAYARFLRAGKPFELLANGIDPIEPDAEKGRQLRDDLGIDPGTFVFLSVGAVKAEKGYGDLLAACERLCARSGGESLTVLVAGALAEPSHLEELQQHVADKGLGGVVRFLGHVDNVAALYGAADALVLPSRTEGLPLALLEAMSAGLPVVATAVGGVPGLL